MDAVDSGLATMSEDLREILQDLPAVIGTTERTTTEAELAAAVQDLEEIMFRGGQYVDTCHYCKTTD